MTEIDPGRIAELVRAIPVYTCGDAKSLLCGVKERDVEDAIKQDAMTRMTNDGGLVQADNFVAIPEELVPQVAWCYMSSEHYALEKFS